MENNLILKEINEQNLHWRDQNAFISLESYKRRLFFKLMPYVSEKQILSVVGLRRTGKSTILKQIIQNLLNEKKVAPKNTMLLSFDEALITSKLTLARYLDTFLKMTDASQMRYIFLDEIQYVEKWQHILKRYYDTRSNIKFFVSGSSSLFIQKKTTESLAGRIYEFKLDHLGFEEYLEVTQAEKGLLKEYKKYRISDLDEIKHPEDEYRNFLAVYGERLEEYFEKYLLYYQFPEMTDKTDRQIIFRYIEESVYKKSIEYDIPRLFDVNKVDELKFVFRLLIEETGQEIEFGKISSEAGIELNTLKKYLSYYHDSLLFDVLYNFSKSVRKSKRLQKKGYIASTNFFSTFHPEFFNDNAVARQYLGKLVETYVYNMLKEKYEYISFYKKGQKEIDFVCSNEILNKRDNKLIEVKYVSKIEREKFDFLKKTSEETFKTSKYYIFSKNKYNNDGQKIVIPAFLIHLQ